MADTQVSSFTTLTGAGLASGDLWPVIDISASGTAKNAILTTTEVVAGLKLNGIAGIAANTFTGAQVVSVAGVAATPALKFTGAWLTSTAAAVAQLLVEQATASAFSGSASGTGLGINAVTGFAGNLLDAQINGVSKFKITANGVAVASNGDTTNCAYGFASSVNTGIHYSSASCNRVRMTSGGSTVGDFIDKSGSQGLELANMHLMFGAGFNSEDVFVTRGGAAATLQLGKNHATAATNQCLKAHNVTTGTGASLTIGGGTGSVAGGALNLATSVTTGALVNHITIAANGDIVIATSASRKIGFFNATPVVQQVVGGVANSTGGSANGTMSAVTDTTATDQSGTINDNFTELYTFTENVRAALATLGLFA